MVSMSQKFMWRRQFMLSMLLRHGRKKAEDFLMLLFIASFVKIQLNDFEEKVLNNRYSLPFCVFEFHHMNE